MGFTVEENVLTLPRPQPEADEEHPCEAGEECGDRARDAVRHQGEHDELHDEDRGGDGQRIVELVDEVPADRQLPGDRKRERELVDEHQVAACEVQPPGDGEQYQPDDQELLEAGQLEEQSDEHQDEDAGEPAGDAEQQRDEPRPAIGLIGRRRRIGADEPALAQCGDQRCLAHAASLRHLRASCSSQRLPSVDPTMSQSAARKNMISFIDDVQRVIQNDPMKMKLPSARASG